MEYIWIRDGIDSYNSNRYNANCLNAKSDETGTEGKTRGRKGKLVMPIGVLSNSLAVVIGGMIGLILGDRLDLDFKEKLNMIFGVCAMGMGISSVILMKNMPAVIFAVVVGTAVGLAIHLGDRIQQGAGLMQRVASGIVKPKGTSISEEEFMATLVTVIILFCASGTGIYGSIVAGMTGDHSILIAKSVLDLFTAMIFGCMLGGVVSLIAIPQMLIFLAMFFCAGLIYPLTTPEMIDDFKAAGGFIMLATAFRMMKVKMFPIADMLPAMVLVFPASWIWSSFILPLVS